MSNETKTPALADLGLSEPLLRATEALDYETATPIQAAAIPVVLSGADLIGCAQTGTGKTAAFTLPTLDRLMATMPEHLKTESSKAPSPKDEPKPARGKQKRRRRPAPRPIRALVLSPTRELSAQIGESLRRYGRFTPIQQTVIYGGVSQVNQVKALQRGVDALVATPGRLLDLVGQGHVDLSKVEVLIFDEADQMLDMGFLPDLRRIVKLVPRERQTLMFSATMPPAIRELAQQWLRRPESIEVAPVATPAERIAQSVHLVDKKRKPELLSHYLTETPRGRTLVFSRTKHGADKIVKRLMKDGVQAAAIHGNKSQGARNRALDRFKGKKPPVLVATDIAARGLDISGVSHVINFDLPETPETYVHRIGRTARAGAEGVAVSFCAGDERGLLKQIERLIKLAIEVEPTVEGFEPRDPATPLASPRKKGRGGRPRGPARPGKKKPTSKTKRSGAKAGEGTSSGKSSRRKKPTKAKGSTAPPPGYKPKKKAKRYSSAL
ncbi:MAG: DEAD/DEAH box helicase [Planctomycetota bacterium]